MSSQNKSGLIENIQVKAVLNLAREIYESELQNSQRALSYLIETRKIGNEAMRHFNLGFAPYDYSLIIRKIHQDEGYSIQVLKEAGLVKDNKRPDSQHPHYDFFGCWNGGRLMIPFIDQIGGDNQVLSFSGRLFDNPDPKKPKYINTSENPIFKKKSFLYNWREASDEARKEGRLLLFEAPISVISAWQNGIRYSTSIAGSALTHEHMEKIRERLPQEEIILCFDLDRPGIEATTKAVKNFLRYNIKVWSLIDIGEDKSEDEKPAFKDPDDLFRINYPLADSLNSSFGGFDYLYIIASRRRIPEKIEDKLRIINQLKPDLSPMAPALRNPF